MSLDRLFDPWLIGPLPRQGAGGVPGFRGHRGVLPGFRVRLLRSAEATGRGAVGRGDRLYVDGVRDLERAGGVSGRPAVRRYDDDRFRGRLYHPCLFGGIHARGKGLYPVFHLFEPIRLRHAGAGVRKQLPFDVRRLGRRRAVFVSSDRVLLRKAVRVGCGGKRRLS